MLSETGIVAVPSSADAWTDVATFTVPANVSRLRKVKTSIAPDWGTDPTSVRVAPVFRLIGSGLLEQSPHEFLGNFGGIAATTIGSGTTQDDVQEHDVDIPVQPGGTYTVQVNTLDEAITAGTVRVEVEYDEQAAKAKNSMSQYIDAALDTTADRWQEIGSGITIPEVGEKSPTKIKRLDIGVAPDQGTSAVSLRVGVRVRLTGSGIKRSGSLEFLAKAAGNETKTDGVLAYSNMTKRHDVDIEIVAGGLIHVEQRVDVETPSAGTIAVGLQYE